MSIPYFFSTGMARSGTNLLSKIISANSQVHAVLGSNIELYRFARDEILKINFEYSELIPKSSGFSDFFGEPKFFDILTTIFNSKLDFQINTKRFEQYFERGRLRIPQDSPDINKQKLKLRGKNFAELLDNYSEQIMKIRNLSSSIRIGFHESWHIELFPALNSLYPKAKFIVMLRDVRGSYASHKMDTENSLAHRASLVSYARQFRKYAALSKFFVANYDNFYLMKYENLMRDPNTEVKKLCEFLEIGFEEKMLDYNFHRDPFTNVVWQGNSGDKTLSVGFSETRNTKWKSNLNDLERRTLETLCRLSLLNLDYEIGEFNQRFPKDIKQFLTQSLSLEDRWKLPKLSNSSITNQEISYFNILQAQNKVELKNSLLNFFSPEYFFFK